MLTRMRYESRRSRFGPCKIAEQQQSGDSRKLLETLLKSALLHDDHVEAERLRKALHPQLANTLATSTIVETEPELQPEPVKRHRRIRSKAPASSSSLTREQASRLAWEELLRRRAD
jgi:hypothetical protein